jgi:hypothetical protein
MTEGNKERSTGRVFLELALLAGIGGWFCVCSLMAILGNAPGDKLLAQETALAIGLLGSWPTFLASLAVAGIGAWSFLATKPVPALRHAAGALVVGVGLAIALGPFRGGAGSLGGHLGEVVPSLVAGRLGVALAVGLGLAVILAIGWLLWLPESEGFSPKPGEQHPVPAAGDPEAGGVTRAEAEALVAEVPRPAAIPIAFQTPSPADDVRNQGGVPPGARPLEKLHERPEDHDQERVHAGHTATSGRAAHQLSRTDLASPGAAPAGHDAGEPLAPEADAPAPPRALSAGVRPIDETPAVPDRPIWEPAADAPAAGLFAEPEPEEPAWHDPADLPSAAWEAPPEAYDPPVDEVLTLPEEDEEAPAEAEDDPAPTPADEDDAEPADDEEELVEAYAEDDADEEEDEDGELDEDEEELEEASAEDDADQEEDEDDELDDDEEELAEASVEDDADEEEDEDDELDDDEEELAEASVEDDADEEEDEDDELDDDEEELAEASVEDDYDEDEDEDEEEEEHEEASAEDDADEEEHATAELDDEEEPEEIHPEHAAGAGGAADAARGTEAGVPAASAGDGAADPPARDSAPAAELERGSAAAAARAKAEPAPERVAEVQPAQRSRARTKRAAGVTQSGLFDEADAAVELSPVEVPAPTGPALRAAVSAASDVDGPEELILQAGLLCLEENRVAVSMLQRRFGLDFDQATTVLDALQERGLIGPYLGGKTRDILMTREEWTAQAHGV